MELLPLVCGDEHTSYLFCSTTSLCCSHLAENIYHHESHSKLVTREAAFCVYISNQGTPQPAYQYRLFLAGVRNFYPPNPVVLALLFYIGCKRPRVTSSLRALSHNCVEHDVIFQNCRRVYSIFQGKIYLI